MRVSIDDGVTWVEVTGGVRVDIDLTGDDNKKLSATINFTSEGIIADLWGGKNEECVGTFAGMYDDIPTMFHFEKTHF